MQIVLLALLAACGPSFSEVQQQDTIEAYEAWLKDHPDHPQAFTARTRLEELYLERAREEGTLEAFDRYLERFPNGQIKDKVLAEREEFLFRWAEEQNTLEAWKRFLDEYPNARKKRKAEARRRLKVLEVADRLTIGEPRVRKVNLAEDPEGPLNGVEVRAPITNGTDRAIAWLDVEVQWLDEGGKVIKTLRWPWVAPRGPGGVPVEESFKKPVQPGETREYVTTDEPAEDGTFPVAARLVPVAIKYVGE